VLRYVCAAAVIVIGSLVLVDGVFSSLKLMRSFSTWTKWWHASLMHQLSCLVVSERGQFT